MFWRPPKCSRCGALLVVGQAPQLEGRSGEVEVTIAPHYFLVCPERHERRIFDMDYPVHCQEWLIDDRVLDPLLSEPQRHRGLCRCEPGTTPCTTEIETREHVVTHRRRRAEPITNTVTFRFPVRRCTVCGEHRSIIEDFEQAWSCLGDLDRSGRPAAL